jgi:PKD repeat protein
MRQLGKYFSITSLCILFILVIGLPVTLAENSAQFQFGSNLYQVIDTDANLEPFTDMDWEAARDLAMQHDMPDESCTSSHLVTITTVEENDFLIETFGAEALHSKWLGGFQNPPETEVAADNWEWVTGELWDFTAWGASEPNDNEGPASEMFLDYWMENETVVWNDDDNTSINNGYVVEFECGLTPLPEEPSADAGGPYDVDEGSSIDLAGTMENASSASWSFDDGSPGCNTLECSYTGTDGPATVIATLTVCDDNAVCAEDTADITVHNVAPTVTAGPDGIEVARNEMIDFTGSFTDPAGDLDEVYSILWDFGDGNTSEELNPQYSYPDLGIYTITLCVTDKDGGEGCAEISVEVINYPPDCDAAMPSIDTIWSPNHEMVPVNILITDPDGDPVVVVILAVTHDEDENGLGDGNTEPDGGGIGTATALVRAERSGLGNGRTYSIEFFATDNLPNGECTGVVNVFVPHDMGNGNTAVDTTTDVTTPSEVVNPLILNGLTLYPQPEPTDTVPTKD